MKRFFVLVLLSFCLVNQAFTQQMAIIDSELYELMNSNSSDKINVNIILKEQFDANQMNVRRSFSSREDRRTYMVNEMKAQTENLQADVLKTLKANERSVQVTDIKCHWLTNMINCNATPDAILKIAEHPDVKMIAWNKKRKVIHDESEKTTVETRATAAEIAENIAQVNAPQVWDLGFTGKGVVVAVIDSGANIDHVDLKDHLWDDGSGHCGFNTIDNSYNVYDGFHHGTHCAGTVCGDGTSGLATGVAPDAQLMVLKALDDEGESAVDYVVRAMEWAIEHGADVLSMSLGFNEVAYYVSDSETFRPMAVNALDAGVVAVVAAGNEGNQKGTYPVPQNIGVPGNCPPPWLHPDQITTGGLSSVICVGSLNYEATDARDASSEGPVTWLQTSYGDYRLGNVYPTKTLKYDNGTYSKNYHWTTADRFATLFTPSELAEFSDGAVLTSVSIYDALEDGGLFYICQGGNTPSEGTQLHSQTYNHYGSKSMFEIALNKEVTIDKDQNLWVVFQPSASANTIPVSTNTDNPNGRWLDKNGSWSTSIINETVMVRANISTSNVPTELNVGLIRPDVSAPGSNVVSSSNESNSGYKTESGTSMATPCVAGAIALLLEANPELEPADICRVLETTAVKVAGATSKSNKTGSGMIDAYNAVFAVATDLPFVAPKLTATAKSSSRIDLSWTVAPGADSYTIYRNGDEIANGIITTSYSDTDLDPETTYSYEIKAFRDSESVKSEAVSATTKAESAAYRIRVNTSTHEHYGEYLNIKSNTSPTGSDDNNTYVNVSTYAESNNQLFTLEDAGNGKYYLCGADGYYIKCGTNNFGKPWNVYAYSTTDKTPILFDYVDGSNFYLRDSDKTGDNYFKVENGNIFCDAPSSNTDVVTWTLEPVGPPVAPTGLVATAKGETSIGLTWNAVMGATSYNVYRNDSEIATGLTAPSYTDNNGLTAETNYCYTVSAVNANGVSAKSTQACATTLAAGSAVEQEVSIGGDVNSNNTSSNLPINAYYSYTFSQQIYTQSEIGTGAGTITKLAFKKQTDRNTNRKIKVYMQNTSKASFASNTDWVSMTDADKVFEGEVNLSGADNDLELTLNTQFSYTGENLLISVYDYTGTDNNTTYFYTYSAAERSLYVRSYSTSYNPENMTASGTRDGKNNIIDITIETVLSSDVPSSPENLVATAQGSTSIALSWDAVDGAISYNIYDAESNFVASTENNTYTITELSPATEYCYTVTAVNAIGDSEASEPACAETESDNTGGDIEDDLNGEEHLVVIGDTPQYSLNELPITTYYNYGYSQQIYTKDEIGINSGTITKIAFKQSNEVTYTRSNVVVYMQNTTKASYSSGSDWVNVTDDTKVFEGSLTTPGTNRNLEITLDTPLKYTGENLLISICDNSGVWNGKSKFYIYDPSAYRSIYTVNDDAPYTSLNMNGSVSGEREGYNNYIEITIMTAGSSTPETPEAPNAPTNLVATAQSSTSISLIWDEVDGAESYNIYRDSELLITGISENSYIDEVLTPSRTYCYTVKAVKGGVESAASEQKCATTEADNTPEAPDAPTGLVATAQSSSSIALSWDAVDGAESYNVYIGNYKLASGLETTSYTATDLESAEKFCFTVKAVREDVESAASNESCATTLAEAPNVPSVPTNLVATAQSSSSISLTWSTVAGAESYKVFRNSVEVKAGITGTSYVDTGLNPNTTYSYTVKAVNATGDSEASSSASATTFAESVAIEGQYRIKVSSSSHSMYGKYLHINSYNLPSDNTTTLIVSDKEVSNAQIFTIESAGNENYYLRGADGNYIKCGDALINGGRNWLVYAYSTTEKTPIRFEYADEDNFYIRDYDKVTGTNQNAKPAESYFKVENGKIYCNSLKSVSDVVTWVLEPVGSTNAPDAPTNLVATAESSSSISLTWDAVDGATSYNVYRDSRYVGNTTETYYTDNGLTPVTNYCYTVTALKDADESVFSEEDCETTQSVSVDHNGMEKVVTIGGTQYESSNLPFNTWMNYSYSQQIYTKAEIDPDGIAVGGKITKIAFKQSNYLTETRNIVVYMQNTDKTSFTSTKNWGAVTAVDKVFEGDVALPGTGGSLEITLNSPIEYTGGNLLISIYDKTNVFGGQAKFYTYSTNANRALQTQGISCNPETMSGSSITGEIYDRNNSIDFTFVLPVNEYTGDGNWNDASNWEEGLPNSNSNVLVSGNVVITDDVTVKTLVINDGGSVTLESGSLTVKDDFTNTDASAFVIEDGAQVFQKNDDVMATFRMNIKAPTAWNEKNITGWQFISSPMKDAATASFVPNDHDYDLFKYVGGVELEWVNYKGHVDNDFEAKFKQGYGYMASYEVEGYAEFAGVLNNETSFEYQNFNALNDADYFANFYLLGNPFAFDMKWNNNNIAASGLAEGYAVVTTEGGYEYSTSNDIKVGDGFFVKVTGTNPSLSYTANTRNRNIEENEYINLIATSKAGKDNVIINFADNSKDGFTKLENFNQDIAKIYVKENDVNYAILNYDEDVEEINLFFNAKKMGEYTINAITEGKFASVILVDKHLGVETNLITSSYTFKATSNDDTDRFVLKMNKGNNENFVYQSGEELIINAKGIVQIIDVMGRIVYSNDIVNDNHSVNISSYNSAVYMVRVLNANDVKTQKIVVY